MAATVPLQGISGEAGKNSFPFRAVSAVVESQWTSALDKATHTHSSERRETDEAQKPLQEAYIPATECLATRGTDGKYISHFRKADGSLEDAGGSSSGAPALAGTSGLSAGEEEK